MRLNEKEYQRKVKAVSTKSPKLKDFIYAYLVGGLICAIGELIGELYAGMGVKEDNIKILIPCTLIFISVLLTGLRIFPKISKCAGAGVLVPITGFANAVAAPAIEFKNEGFIIGVGTKIFAIAGPVILYGTVASAIYGIIYWIIKAVM